MTIRSPERRPLASRRRFLALVAAAHALATIPGVRAAGAPGDAERFVEELGRRTLDVLADGSLGREAKVDRLVALVDDATDLELIARLALGRAWRDLDEARRAEYVTLFRGMLRRVLAERLGSYSGETFRLAGARPVDARDTVVTTLVGRPGGPTYRIEWRVRDQDGRLAVVDVIAEGVSLLVTQRAEFSDILQREGMDGLLGRLRERASPPPGATAAG